MTTFYTRPVAAHVIQPDKSLSGAVWVLAGADMEACEAIGKLPQAALKTTVVAPRDMGRHRYLMKLFAVAHKALPETWPAMSYDTFRAALMIDAGFYDDAYIPDATDPGFHKITMIPWSLEFAAMEDTRHREVVDGVIHCLVSKWIPGLNHEAFENEVLEAIR